MQDFIKMYMSAAHIPDDMFSRKGDASLDYQLNLADVLCKKAIEVVLEAPLRFTPFN